MQNYPYLVSILVPLYGVEKYIERCATSVFSQTYPHVEYIFVDDCSPDNSLWVLQQTIERFSIDRSRVKIISHDMNRGLAAARNTALENAHGEFVMHVDSDDWLEPDAVKLLVNKQQQEDFDIVIGKALAIHSDHTEEMPVTICNSKEKQIEIYLKQTLQHVIWARLIRKSIYTTHNIKAEEGTDFGEDAQVVPKLFYYAEKTAWINDVVYNYNRTNENSYTANKTFDINKRIKKTRCDLRTTLILRDFFQDKGNNYMKIIHHNLISNSKRLARDYCKTGDKTEFKCAYNYIKQGHTDQYWRRARLLLTLPLYFVLCRVMVMHR
jgi:glycosyltransferase involved in cell wall biosynthesis